MACKMVGNSMVGIVHVTSIEMLQSNLSEMMPETEWRFFPIQTTPNCKDINLERPIENDAQNKQKGCLTV